MSVAVIGGGAAGMMAAAAALEAGAAVTLYEPNRILGKKLRITGKGRCNVTNNCPPEEILKNVITNKKFLYSSIYKFTPEDCMAYFEGLGVPLKTERGRRVFPVSDKAADVSDALENYIVSLGCDIIRQRATGIIISDGKATGVLTPEGPREHSAVILCTGGVSYPGTGSTGDGHRMARELGIAVTPLKPSLVPVILRENTAPLMGLSLKNVRLCVFLGDKEITGEMGEMLFTHFGVSGPLVLSASAHMQEQPVDRYRMEIDLKPALDSETLDRRLIQDLQKYSAKDFINSLGDLLPAKLIDEVVRRCGIDPRKKSGEVTKAERHRLLDTLKHFTLTPRAFRSLDEAVVTAGGIDVKEIQPATMMSKTYAGLFFAGEIIDVDAYTGGYNLQIAWSTGRKAGESAADYSFKNEG
ncbi:MAG: aminoacetone oxidase family FAD-binding enzyme [Ruminococcaceae bacterium]|nr:aminoacetone oxidase family FAD-binding enzyme [Oscillospiraceae bacterium]